MKKLWAVVGMAVFLFSGAAFARGRGGGGGHSRGGGGGGHVVHVRGSTTKSGTTRAPHVRTAPDQSTRNNWSTKGNVNPYTGKAGTKNPK